MFDEYITRAKRAARGESAWIQGKRIGYPGTPKTQLKLADRCTNVSVDWHT